METSKMTWRRGLILSIITAGCWVILFAMVLNSIVGARNNHNRQKANAAQGFGLKVK
jgi:hypothetical protein